MGTSIDENSEIHSSITDRLNKARRSNLLYTRNEFTWYEYFNRFGSLDPYNKLQTTRDYLFFSKPDLHIFNENSNELQPLFANDPFFVDMKNRYPYVLHQLQRSSRSNISTIDSCPFITILTNGVTSSLDLQSITANEMDNAANMYGTSIPYRKDGWTSDESVDFSLEFEDTKFLEIYYMTKIYEEYHRKYNTGRLYPPNLNGVDEDSSTGANFNSYIQHKILHDVFGIWRVVVDEDMESIIFWAYVCGAYFNNVPRDAFNDISGNTGCKLNLDFKAFCIDDNNPMSLIHFNQLISNSYGLLNSDGTFNPNTILDIYDPEIDGINGSWARHPYIIRVNADDSWYASKGMKYKYKLVWVE